MKIYQQLKKAAKTELIKKFLYELCVYGKSECELSHLPLKEYLPLDLFNSFGTEFGLY